MRKEDFLENLSEEDKEKLLQDLDGNDIPDFLEQGMIPEEMGIETGEKMDDKNREVRKGNAKILSKFVRVSKLKEQMTKGESGSFQETMEKTAQSGFKKWLPLIFFFDVIFVIIVLYFVFR